MPKDRFICETTFRVRYAETDSMGVVHHSMYLVWFEEGRSAYIRDHGWSYADIEQSGYFLAAGDLKAKYRRAARYDQRVTVKTWIEDVRSRTISFGCEIVEAETHAILFEATLKLICLNASGEITRVPNDWMNWLYPQAGET
ncbi:MAG: thioesterase family protein [Chloroflexi bacterium]|nr:thioesterase family protein [Chloroflexota bacterium]